MKDRAANLTRYQKFLLFFMIAIAVAFTAVYIVTASRVGYAYRGAILEMRREDGVTTYSGKLRGRETVFTVSGDRTITLQWGETVYGPYTVTEDPTAVPKDGAYPGTAGLELRRGEEILFRGVIWPQGDGQLLIGEDGNVEFGVTVETDYGVTMDEKGNVIDPMEPNVSEILEVMQNPKLTHKGAWGFWALGVFVCLAGAANILFADELFRLRMSLNLYNADQAEPSDLALAARTIGWTLTPAAAVVVFVMGLR